jgi:hypothetical protein
MAVSTSHRAPYHYGGYSQSLVLLVAGRANAATTTGSTSATAVHRPLVLALPQVGEAAALTSGHCLGGGLPLVIVRHPGRLLRRVTRLSFRQGVCPARAMPPPSPLPAQPAHGLLPPPPLHACPSPPLLRQLHEMLLSRVPLVVLLVHHGACCSSSSALWAAAYAAVSFTSYVNRAKA